MQLTIKKLQVPDKCLAFAKNPLQGSIIYAKKHSVIAL